MPVEIYGTYSSSPQENLLRPHTARPSGSRRHRRSGLMHCLAIHQENCSIVLMAQSHRVALQRLFEIAQDQQGFFTAKQAKVAGFAENTHPYHVKIGNWIREHRGIYRLAQFPASERPDLVLWSLWSRNRRELLEGAYSHQTALRLHDLSDVNPSKLHMTVPTAFRRNAEIPGALVLHYADVPDADVQTATGFRFTRPLRTIVDVIAAGDVERTFLQQALRQAFDRGLITRRQVASTAMSEPARKFIEQVLRRVA